MLRNKKTYLQKRGLLGKFIFLYVFQFFFYGYLFLAGCVIIGILFFQLFFSFHGIIKYLQLLWAIPFIYCLIRFITILSTTYYKWRFYRLSHYRLSKRGYSEDYFKYEIFEPCTRLIVRNVLFEYNLKDEYQFLKKKYLKVNQRIEDEKVRILTHVIRKNKNNQIKEIVYGKDV